MKKLFLFSMLALFAFGCATTSTTTKVSTSPAPGVMAGANHVPAAVHVGDASMRTLPNGSLVTARVGAVNSSAMSNAQSFDQYGSDKAKAQGGSTSSSILYQVGPEKANGAIGGTGNNPAEEASSPGPMPTKDIEISVVSSNQRGVSSDKRRLAATASKTKVASDKLKEEITKASWIEGNNPVDDTGYTLKASAPTSEAKENKTSTSHSKKIMEKLSPYERISNNNPMDDSSYFSRPTTSLNTGTSYMQPPKPVTENHSQSYRVRHRIIMPCDNNPIDPF